MIWIGLITIVGILPTAEGECENSFPILLLKEVDYIILPTKTQHFTKSLDSQPQKC